MTSGMTGGMNGDINGGATSTNEGDHSGSKILFLTYRMCRGYGVDVVVSKIGDELIQSGYQFHVGCFERDDQYTDPYIVQLPPDETAILNFVQNLKPTVIVAHTTPFFELLPKLKKFAKVIAFEHGDPTPELFPEESEIRTEIKAKKEREVYPICDRVIAITEFIRHDIHWNQAILLPHGCEHVADYGTKTLEEQGFLSANRPIRVGTLMRLGAGEAHYKGNAEYRRMVELVRSHVKGQSQINGKANAHEIEFHVMGRGTEKDAAAFREMGFKVHLNATDAEREKYLRDLDVFVHCSLWEGFNLPIVEAQALGTVSLALDTGAHPEVCPYLCESIETMARQVIAFSESDALRGEASELCYRFVRRQFQWTETAKQFRRYLTELLPSLQAVAGQNSDLMWLQEKKQYLNTIQHYRSILDTRRHRWVEKLNSKIAAMPFIYRPFKAMAIVLVRFLKH